MIEEYDNIISGYSFIFLKDDIVMTAQRRIYVCEGPRPKEIGPQ